MSQFLRPIADVQVTGWTALGLPAPLWQQLDNVPGDGSVSGITNPTGDFDADIYVCQLSAGQEPQAGTVTLRVETQQNEATTISLMQGATTLQSWNISSATARTVRSFTVNATITDYSDLRVRIRNELFTGSTIHAIELKLPDAASAGVPLAVASSGSWVDLTETPDHTSGVTRSPVVGFAVADSGSWVDL